MRQKPLLNMLITAEVIRQIN